MPFGPKTCPAIFQRILSGIIKKYNLTGSYSDYLDEILVYSKSFDEHLKHIQQFLDAIKDSGFHLKLIKCSFAKNSVSYLGHKISKKYSETTDYNNLKAIKDFLRPQTQKNARLFLGKINFHHKYIRDSTKLLGPLHNLLRKDQQFMWSNECEKAFEMAKEILIYLIEMPTQIYIRSSLFFLLNKAVY